MNRQAQEVIIHRRGSHLSEISQEVDPQVFQTVLLSDIETLREIEAMLREIRARL